MAPLLSRLVAGGCLRAGQYCCDAIGRTSDVCGVATCESAGIIRCYLGQSDRGEAMAHSGALVEVLKRELRTKGVTYAQVARKLGLSEASVKRMFSRRDFTLKRLDQVCQLTNAD